MKTTLIVLLVLAAGYLAYKKFFCRCNKSTTSAAPATPAATDTDTTQQQ